MKIKISFILSIKMYTPEEIIRKYIGNHTSCDYPVNKKDSDLDHRWEKYVKKIKILRQGDTFLTLPILDISGSMFTEVEGFRPIDKAISIGLLLSMTERRGSPFYNKWMNFSIKPSVIKLKGKYLSDILRNLSWSKCNEKIDYYKAFSLAFKFIEPKCNIRFVVLTDKDFEESKNEEIKCEYNSKSIKYQIVFFNLNSRFLYTSEDFHRECSGDDINGDLKLLTQYDRSCINKIISGKFPF